jgi:hypothetical protein
VFGVRGTLFSFIQFSSLRGTYSFLFLGQNENGDFVLLNKKKCFFFPGLLKQDKCYRSFEYCSLNLT